MEAIELRRDGYGTVVMRLDEGEVWLEIQVTADEEEDGSDDAGTWITRQQASQLRDWLISMLGVGDLRARYLAGVRQLRAGLEKRFHEDRERTRKETERLAVWARRLNERELNIESEVRTLVRSALNKRRKTGLKKKTKSRRAR